MKRVINISRTLLAPSDAAQYIGVLGIENLGDEAVYQAIRECFPRPVIAATMGTRIPGLQGLLNRKLFACAILGGGTLIGHNGPADNFRTAIDRSGKGIVFGTGVAPVEDPSDNWLERWREVLERCAYVGVRGPDSVQTLAKIGIRAELLGDPACRFAKPAGFWQPKDKVIGLNVGRSQGGVYGGEDRVLKVCADFARTMVADGWQVEFFVVWPDDLPVAREVAAMADIRTPTLHVNYFDAEAYVSRVRQMRAFVGIKLHAVMLAMCAAVPAIMLEYRSKCSDFMKSVDMGHYTVRTDQVTSATCLDLFHRLLSEENDVSEHIQRAMCAHKTRLEARALELDRIISAGRRAVS